MGRSRRDELIRLRADYDALLTAAKAAEHTGDKGSAVGTAMGASVGLLGRLLDQVADLDEEVTALRKEVKRAKK